MNEKINQIQSNEQTFNDDEINLKDFFQKIYKEKNRLYKNICIALFIWLIAYTGYIINNYDSSTYYSQTIGLNFPQASQGKYPNGSILNASDIISNTVLEKVWTKNKLADKNIPLPVFLNSFTSTTDVGEVNFIDRKYRDLLASKNLTRADIDKIENDYKNETQSATNKKIKITFDTRGLRYESFLAQKILIDVTEEWNKVAIEKLGVLKSPILDGVTLNDEIKDAPPYVVLSYLNDATFKLKTILDLMLAEPSSNGYRDSETNLNLSGVESKLHELSKYQIDRLDAIVAINFKPSEIDILETQYKLKDLKAQKLALEQNADSNRRALLDYSTTTSQVSASSYADGKSKSTFNDSTGVQLNSDAITKIFSLATESKDADYRQGLTSKRIAIENQAQNLSLQIQKIERRIASVTDKNIKATEETRKDYFLLLDKTWLQLKNLINITERIRTQVRNDFTSSDGHLYNLISQPSSYSLNSGLFKYALASILGALFFSVLFSFLQIYFQSLNIKRGEG